MFGFLAPILSTIGGAVTGVGSMAASGISTLGATAYGLGAGAVGLGSQVGSTLGATAYGMGAGAYGLGSSVISTIGSAGQLVAGNIPAIADISGQILGAYTSYEQAKAARKAAEKYGEQVNIPTISSAYQQAPAPAAAIPTLSYGGGGQPMTEEERLYMEAKAQQQSDTGKFMMYALVALGGYLLLVKKK